MLNVILNSRSAFSIQHSELPSVTPAPPSRALPRPVGARLGAARAAHRGAHGTHLAAGRARGAAGGVGVRLCLPVGVVCGAQPADQDDGHGADSAHRPRRLGAVERGVARGRGVLAVAPGDAGLASGVGARRRLREPHLRLRRAALSALARRRLSAGDVRGEPRSRPPGAPRAGAGARSRAALAPVAARSALSCSTASTRSAR